MPSGQAKMSKLHGRSYKNQSFVLFAIECVWKWILDGFWSLIGDNFDSQVAVRSDFESKCYKVCKSGGVGVVCPPSPPLNVENFSASGRDQGG